jgi:DNA-binding response OmpR family regulator
MRAKYRTGMSSRKTIVSSDKNAGSCYTFVTDWWSEMAIVQQQRILVVEPDDQILGLLERWLAEAGYAVTMEASLRQHPVAGGADPQLVIIDVPEPLGAEKIIESVRQVHASAILLLSARFRRGMGSSSSVARQLGVRNVLPKPFTRDELLSAVVESIDEP